MNPELATLSLNDLPDQHLVIDDHGMIIAVFGGGERPVAKLTEKVGSPLTSASTSPVSNWLIGRDAHSAEIARTILALGARLERAVVAEGVETAAQLANLGALDCRFAQGYLFSKPVAAESIPSIVAAIQATCAGS